MKKILQITVLLMAGTLLFSCSSLTKSSPRLKVSYDEFEKVLSPRGYVLVDGENSVLVLLARPGDAYPKIYRYNWDKKEFSLDYDHGFAISSLSDDVSGKNIYLHIDNNGDENTQIYLYDPQTKKPKLLFGKPGFQTTLLGSDEAGENLFFNSNFENKAIYSVYKINIREPNAPVRLSDGKTNLYGSYVDLKGQTVVAIRPLSNNENQVFKIDVAKQEMTSLFQRANSVFTPGFISQDGRFLFGSTDFNRDRVGCARIDLNKPNQIVYVHEDPKKDIRCSYGQVSKLYSFYETSRGKTQLRLFKKFIKEEVKIPQLFNNQSVSALDFDPKKRELLLRFTAANNPGGLYLFNVDTLKVQPVLDLNQSKIQIQDLATSFDFDYKSFDGLDIHAILIAKEQWKTSGKKFPLVIWPHGGPDSHEGHNYREWFQFLALNDFVVLAPNFRGSTGYGKKFETLNDKDWGGGHIRDLIEAKKAAAKLPWIDNNNIFIYGGSFGGYSTLAAITFYPKEFKAAVGIVAIGNLFTFMKSIPPDEAWQSEFLREVGDPVKDKKLYEERSPFFHVNRIEVPLKIYQAENDVRTVKAEMDTFVEEMKKHGKKVDYTVLKKVGHGLERPEARRQVAEGTVDFFKSMME